MPFKGAIAVTAGFAGIVYALIEGPSHGWSLGVIAAGAVGAVALAAFPFIELRQEHPLVPLGIFRSRQFSGANLTTLAVYAGLGTALFLVVVELQTVLGYSAIEAGSALLPITVIMLALSSRAGRLSQRIGPRLPMTIGPLVVATGLALLSGIGTGDSYLTSVLPGVVVLGLGLSLTVAPLTAAVLAAVEENHVGVGSGVNNAVARVASLLSVAVLPSLVGLSTAASDTEFTDGVGRALLVSAGLAVAGGLVAAITIRRAAPHRSITQASVTQSCHDPCVRDATAEAA
jgi:hypothetical protein